MRTECKFVWSWGGGGGGGGGGLKKSLTLQLFSGILANSSSCSVTDGFL